MKKLCKKLRPKIRLGLLLGFCVLPLALPAQRMTVQGTILDSSGEPVIGANVIVRGSSVGVAADLDGKFRLDVAPDATLAVSCLGYNPQEVAVDGRSQITIVLQENAVALQEVVAIGYGTVRKSDATGSVTLVKPVQPEKAYQPILATPSGMVTLVRAVQSAKAYQPISFTLSGMVTRVRLVNFWKAYTPIPVTSSGIDTLAAPLRAKRTIFFFLEINKPFST